MAIDSTINEAPITVDEAVRQIIDSIPFRECVIIAHVDKSQKTTLEQIYSRYIKAKIENWSESTELMKSCVEHSKCTTLGEIPFEALIIKLLLKKLRETHKLRVINRAYETNPKNSMAKA